MVESGSWSRQHELTVRVLLIGLVALVGCRAPSPYVGHYRDVSESESSIDLHLEADGTARIVLQTWQAGSDEREITTHTGSWSSADQEITLSYNGGTETLQYSEALSFADFGCRGESAGSTGNTRDPWL